MDSDFEEFVIARGHVLLRFAYLLTGDRYLAEDLTQEALVRVHRRWSALERREQPEPYLRKAIVRQFLSWRRRRSSGEIVLADVPERPAGEPGGDLAADRLAERDEMWSLLARLPRQQRAVLVLRYYEDLADRDIARVLGCTESTVRGHAFKALRALRTIAPQGLVSVGEGCAGD